MKMNSRITVIISIIMVFLTAGCTSKMPAAPTLTKKPGDASITVYCPALGNFILRQQNVIIIVDKERLFYLKSGEQITFYLSPGNHEIAVQAFSGTFTKQHALSITMAPEHAYYVRTYPVFEGVTYVPYWFIPIPMPDMRFRINEVSEEAAKQLMTGKPVDPKERALNQ